MLLKNLFMKIKFNNLLKGSTILSVPGILSIFISLLSIPIHLNYAGPENYGNYIIFHFILLIAVNFNFGIGKSTAISINNFPKKKKEVGFKSIIYTINIALVIGVLFLLLYFLRTTFLYDYTEVYKFTSYFFLGSIITIFFVSFEGILQGNQKFKSISILNLFFFSFSISFPSILLFFNQNFSLENLISISILIKSLSVLIMFLIIKNGNLLKSSSSKILWNNLRKNGKWITLNNTLIQFYELFDKFLIKIFIGPVAVSFYSIPQQLTGKLSIISKSFSAYLLPNLSKKKIDNDSFNFSLEIFIKVIPIFIFLLFPLYPKILSLWLGNSYIENIYYLTKIFSLIAIFACASHLLITKFEASKTLNRNLKIEFLLIPFFLIALYWLTKNNYSLLMISLLVLFKEFILFNFRLNLLKSELTYVKDYFLYSIYFLVILFFSFWRNDLYILSLVFLILSSLKK